MKLQRWYLDVCNSGESCWCRTISTVEGSDRLEDAIACSGSLSKEVAEWVVKLNNEAVERSTQADSTGGSNEGA